MKHIKKFENVNDQPQLDDYVILELSDDQNDCLDKYDQIKQFFLTNIGQITFVDTNFFEGEYYIHFPQPISSKDKKILKSFREQNGLDENEDLPILEYEIKYWAKTIDDLKLKVVADKYNL
jgi:hypothetical protein